MDDKIAKYKMTISRLTVDKLGVKLYDKVSAVIAELIANSYDADATEVTVKAPMGIFLASKSDGKLSDNGLEIEVTDNGIGMTPEEVNKYYLIVGAERRNDRNRGGDESKKFNRKVMGRKGIGKLAPFGVCQRIEILTSGGDLIVKKNEKGEGIKGYLTAHLFLERESILSETDESYSPTLGEFDETLRDNTGTTIRLTIFDYRKVPSIDEFERQLSQRFGVSSSNWAINIIDNKKKCDETNCSRKVGEFAIENLSGTKISLNGTISNSDGSKTLTFAEDENGNEYPDIKSGFLYEEILYPITGWVAYSKMPYKDDLMAGIRVYCRGKIAAQTHLFNMKAGFTGEYDIRSYLIGELNADWLDQNEDLIRTDRQDIMWSHDLGQEFESWGQSLIKKIGKITREPRRKKSWELFKEISGIEKLICEAYPEDVEKSVRDNTLEFAEIIAKTARDEELNESGYIESIVKLSVLLGPHITLDRELRQAAENNDNTLSSITGILKIARIAELSSFGKIAYDRIAVINSIESKKNEPGTVESVFQALIAQAPWLINPQWSPITSNKKFSTLKTEFEKYYKRITGDEIVLNDFSDPKKQCDFVLSNQDDAIQIIEIKSPGHSLANDEMERINNYVDNMKDFLKAPGNEEFLSYFPRFHVTLVCDELSLKGVYQTAFEGLKNEGILEHISWSVFLLRTKKMHEDFLSEADRQKKYANYAKTC